MKSSILNSRIVHDEHLPLAKAQFQFIGKYAKIKSRMLKMVDNEEGEN